MSHHWSTHTGTRIAGRGLCRLPVVSMLAYFPRVLAEPLFLQAGSCHEEKTTEQPGMSKLCPGVELLHHLRQLRSVQYIFNRC